MRSARSIGYAATIVAALAAACSQSGTASPQPFASATLPRATPPACPLAVDGARIDVADIEGGVALTITARADRLEELRHRVRDAAALYGPGAHRGLGRNGGHLGHQRHGLQLTRLVPMNTAVEDVDGGARLTLVAIVPSQVDALRDRVREEVERVSAGPCD